MDHYQEYMGMAGMPNAYYPMMQMPDAQLESMYPRCYYIIYPRVRRMCDMYHQRYGTAAPTPEMMQQMTNSIYDEVEPMMQDEGMDEMGTQMMPMYEQTMPQSDDMNCDDNCSRQFYHGFYGYGPRRRFLRDLIGILLIRDLIGRRPYHYGYY